MNDELMKAAREAVDASDNSRQLELIAAVLTAQQLLNQQQPTPVVHQTTQPFDARKWLTVGAVAVAGGGVACFLALAAALLAVAVAVGGVCATACLIVLRSMWRDYQQNH